MAEGAFEFWIHPSRRDGAAVYAVAIGDRLGMDTEALRQLRSAAEESKLTGDEQLDGILHFLRGSYDHNTLGQFSNPPPGLAAATDEGSKLMQAYFAVAPLIQPLSWESS